MPYNNIDAKIVEHLTHALIEVEAAREYAMDKLGTASFHRRMANVEDELKHWVEIFSKD